MSTTVTTSGKYTDTLQETNSSFPGTATPPAINNVLSHSFSNGTAADQCSKVYAATLSFAGAAQVLNLFDNTSGTQITDLYGTALSLTRVVKIYIKNKATTDGFTLKLGYATTTANSWTGIVTNPGQITIGPSTSTNDGCLLMISGNTTGWVVSTSSKLLNLDPGANTFTADIVIMGN